MSKETFWFKHDYDAADDDKTMLLIEQLGLEGYGIYWLLIEKLRGRNDYKMPFAVIPSLSRRYMTTPEKMKTVITQYGLFEYDDDGFFYSVSLIERMNALEDIKNKRSAAGKLGMEKRWKTKELETKRVTSFTESEEEANNANNVITMLYQSNNSVITPYNDKNRIDKKREDIEKKEDNKLSSKKRFDFKNALIEIGVDESVADDWIRVRKTKKCTQSETAFKSIKKQIELSGASANDCITLAVEHSWAGFKAEWYLNEHKNETLNLFNDFSSVKNEWQTI